MPVTAKEQRAIMDQEDWFATLGVESLFVDIDAPGFKDGALAKRADNSCVFLDSDNLCAIHRKYGLTAKPAACQLFPFVLTPFNGSLKVGLRFDCAGVCRGNKEQGNLPDQIKDIRRIAKQIYPDGLSEAQFEKALPAVYGKQKVSFAYFDKINTTIIENFITADMPLKNKLLWMVMFADHLEKVKWSSVSKDDIDGLISLLAEGTIREASKFTTQNQKPASKARVLFGQILYLLSRSPEIITSEKIGKLQQLKKRFKDAAEIRKFGNSKGELPKLWPHWKDIDISQMEKPFGNMLNSSQELLERYIICRLAGLNYCGLNYYGYSMADGLYSLVLAICSINWLARLNAAMAGRDSLKFSDIESAVITTDSNNGYGTALNTGAAGLRLKYLKNHMPAIISTYLDA